MIFQSIFTQNDQPPDGSKLIILITASDIKNPVVSTGAKGYKIALIFERVFRFDWQLDVILIVVVTSTPLYIETCIYTQYVQFLGL